MYTPTNRWRWALLNHKLSLSYTGGSQLGVVLLALLSQGAVALTEASLIITGEDIRTY